MKKISSSMVLYAIAGLAVLGLIYVVATRKIATAGPSVNDAFAQCLAEKGVTMYGAWWCPHCKAQKALFDTAFQYVTYVECSPNGSKDMSQECKDAGVQGYPTWKFSDGTMVSGEQTFADLAAKTQCPLPASADAAAALTP